MALEKRKLQEEAVQLHLHISAQEGQLQRLKEKLDRAQRKLTDRKRHSQEKLLSSQ